MRTTSAVALMVLVAIMTTSLPAEHRTVLGQQEWLMKRAIEPMADASMTISLLILKKYTGLFSP